MRTLLVFLLVPIVPVVSAAAERISGLGFQVVDQFGKAVPYKVQSCADSTGRDVTNRFSGLEAARLPFGRYTYTLSRRDVASPYGRISGKTDVFRLENWLTLVADPTLEIGPGSAVAVDREVPPDFVIRGRIAPIAAGIEPVWVRLQATYGTAYAEAKVDPTGEFRIYQPLIGNFVLSVLKNGEFLHIEPVVFQDSVHPDPLLIQLGDRPVPRTVH